MTVKKLNIKKLIAVVLVIFIIVGFIIYIIFNKKMKESIEYKLEMVGYSESEVEEVKKLFNESEIEYLLTNKYSSEIISLKKEKYFIFDKLESYLKYHENNKDKSLKEVISIINTGIDIDFYEKIYDTDTSKNELMIVNKYYKLKEDYEPSDLVEVSSRYAYSGKFISKSIYENIVNLITSASESGYTLVVSQGYRSYEEQNDSYNSYKINNGIREADIYVARPGHSEYQTGLSLDIEPYNKIVKDPSTNEEHIWLMSNAYKYGFILRYPKDKESITGFQYNPWRFRYVGVEVATYIYDNDITFDEYYAYFVENKQ